MRKVLLIATSSIALAGCYVDSAEERMPQAPGVETNYQPEVSDEEVCEFRFSKGCFVGHIPASKIFVEGEEFFDAQSLYYKFAELVSIHGKEGSSLTLDKDYELNLLTRFDNRSFAHNFEVFVTGEASKSMKVPMAGEFVLDEMPEGRYEVRVQKGVKFEVTRNVNRPDPQDPDNQTIAIVETTTHCGTIYSDMPLQIKRGEVTRLEFRDFDLHLTDRTCEAKTDDGQVIVVE